MCVTVILAVKREISSEDGWSKVSEISTRVQRQVTRGWSTSTAV